MKKPFTLFALKCAVILYFTACASIDEYTISPSVTPVVTQGAWKVDQYLNAQNDKTGDFSGYQFVFTQTGELKATKNGSELNGSWAENNITKKVILDFGNADPVLSQLNNYWTISSISFKEVSFEDASGNNYHIKISEL